MRCAVSVMNLTGHMTYRFTTSTAPHFENFRTHISPCTATRIMKVYWSLNSFRLFPYRNTYSAGPQTLKKLGKVICLFVCLFGTSSFRVRHEILENLVIIYTTGLLCYKDKYREKKELILSAINAHECKRGIQIRNECISKLYV